MTINETTSRVIGGAIEVHRHLGPGLLESAYQQCLAEELSLRGLKLQIQLPIPLRYKGHVMDCSYRADIIVNGLVVVEVKSVGALQPVHEAQVLTYMRLLQCPVGLLMNFNVPQLIQGLRRLIIDTPSEVEVS